eukprot:Gb_05043 [translate_table: standard]
MDDDSLSDKRLKESSMEWGYDQPQMHFTAISLDFHNYYNSGWRALFWLSFIPLTIILLVRTKLQVMITKMALEIQCRHAVVKGTPVVQPSNELFWFGRPQLILFLIHFTLFQNAFQLAYFFWIWVSIITFAYDFGLKSCFHKTGDIITRIVMGWISLEILMGFKSGHLDPTGHPSNSIPVSKVFCPPFILSAVFLHHTSSLCNCNTGECCLAAMFIREEQDQVIPRLYGFSYDQAIFEEQTALAVKRWHQAEQKNRRQHKMSGHSSGIRSRETTPSDGSSLIHLLHRYKTMGDLYRTQTSERCYHLENEMSDLEMDASPPSPSRHSNSSWITKGKQKTEATGQLSTTKEIDTDTTDFSFAKL